MCVRVYVCKPYIRIAQFYSNGMCLSYDIRFEYSVVYFVFCGIHTNWNGNAEYECEWECECECEYDIVAVSMCENENTLPTK